MIHGEHVEILKKGVKHWNKWRENNPDVHPNLRGVNFYDLEIEYNCVYGEPHFESANFSNTDLSSSIIRDGIYINCNFSNSTLNYADLCFAYFSSCDFSNTSMRVAKIGSTHFNNCRFNSTDLSYASAEDTIFENTQLINSDLININFIASKFLKSEIDGCNIYGISSWDLDISDTIQRNLNVGKDDQILTVDNLEIAQFIYLMINNSKLKSIIDTLTSKTVLILGRFTPERKKVLDIIKNKVRTHDLVPILFDFNGPKSRDVSETVITLAAMSKLIIADISEAKSIPQELSLVVPNLPSVPVFPLLSASLNEYGMFEHFKRYPWVQKVIQYNEDNISVELDRALDVIFNQRIF
ncbi:pentapeptide repeat-containing protein [Paenibacillus elgii]|uniref:pentapeptide repeat-containing protein n=1 Tax=Paenibacillus elgii TaxID=189691 RepID=UPI002D7CBBCF|nr:pentapeptide repeat-containing protein [Paenibacillus elgii]